ncbi:MAG: hypothetical protein LLG09_03900 [Negativicutes bacterium]|nr:hypothetical protein [Negativicutes bacterium]
MKGHHSKVWAALLLFIAILLSGCQTIKYPDTIADMVKLWEGNKNAFDEFAQLILENIPDSQSTLMLSYNQPPGKWSYFYDKGIPGKADLKELTELTDAEKIKAFIDQYSVYQVIADQKQVEIHVYKMSLADQPGHGSEYPPENMKFVRFFTYAVEERYASDQEGYLSEHWLASRPHVDIKVGDGFTTLTYSVESLQKKGYELIEPGIEPISELPFLYHDKKTWEDTVSTVRNHPADYLYEMDGEHLLILYEKDRQLQATIYNWKSRTEVQTVILDLQGGFIADYHVERLNENTFAYAAAMAEEEGAEILSLLSIEQNEIKVTVAGVLPVAGQWTRKGIAINETLSEMAYIDAAENRIVWGDWSPGQDFVEQGSLGSEELAIDALGHLEQLQISAKHTLTYTWGGAIPGTDNEQLSGFGVVNLLNGQVVHTQGNAGVNLTPTKHGVLLGGGDVQYGNRFSGPDYGGPPLPEHYEGINHYITEENIRAFGHFEFSSENRQFVPGYHEQYMAFQLFGEKLSHVTNFYIAWYDYPKDSWDKDIWVIKDTAIFMGARGRDSTRPDATYTISDTGKRIYALGFGEKGETVLNIIEVK